MIDITKVLLKISNKVDKDKKYLKGLFNKEKQTLLEQFGDALDDDRLDMLSLLRVGKRYGLDKSAIDSFIDDSDDLKAVGPYIPLDKKDDDIDTLLEDIIDDEVGVPDVIVADEEKVVNKMMVEIKEKGSISEEIWKQVMETIPEPETIITEYERTPSLIVELGATYHLKMDLTEPPYEHECDGQFGPYMKTAFKVYFDKVSDEELYDLKYKYGDYEGEIAYTKGRKYTLWLDDKAKQYWALFWKKINADGIPDNRVFTFKHTKKGKYNVFKFGLPKR